jgi:RHS repeat-associated protein
MTTITDPRGITYLTNTYDAAGKVATQQLADGSMYYFSYSPDASGYSTQTLVRDPMNRMRLVTYDANHYPATDTQAWGSGMARTVTTVRDPATRQVQRITDPYGRSTTFTYDAAGQVASVSEYVGVTTGRTTYFSYGAAFGQISTITDWGGWQTRFAYNAAGDLTQVTDAAGRRTSTVYDAAGRPTQTIDPLGFSTFIGYELGDPVRLTDRLGRVTRTARDAAGRPVATTSPSGATSYMGWFQNNQLSSTRDAFGYVTAYSYDVNGNLVQVVDTRGSRIQYGYDNRDRLISRTNQLGYVSNVYYDPLDRPVWARDERGKVTQYTYDVLGRLAYEWFGVDPSPMPPQLPPPGQTYEGLTYHEYDAFDRLARLADTHGGTTTYTYDALDQLTGETTAAGQIQYTYDSMGRRATMSAPGAATVSYGYDPTDLLSTLTQGATSVSWQRDGAGRVSRIVAPGVTTAYGYDVENEPIGMVVLTPGGGTLANMSYTWDADGRLASASGSLAMLRITATSPSMTYNAADQLVNRGGTPLNYDAAGNLLSDGTTTYSWDARGRMIGANRPGMSATYTYDSLDRRTDKYVNGARTSYLYDGPNIVREQAPTGTAYRLGAGADETLIRTENGVSQAVVADHLGSTRALVATATSTVSTYYGYDSYGAPSVAGLSSNNPQQYTGREYDTETGLQNNRARYYSPSLGRFISQDPADIGGGSINMYEYAHSDPVNLSDPNGDCIFCLAPAFVSACVTHGAVDAFVNWAAANVSHRKYSVREATRDFAGGCIAGMAIRAVQVVMLYRMLARQMASGQRAVVIGHYMKDRVIPAAKALGAKWLRATGKSGKALFWVTPDRQARWAKWVVDGGYRVFDIGPSPFNPFRFSIFTMIEQHVFRTAGHQVTRIPWWWWELWR